MKHPHYARLLIFLTILQTLIPHLSAVQPSPDITPQPTILQIPVTFISRNYTLYGEIYEPPNTSTPLPAIIICEGAAGYTSAYSWIPNALASHDYIAFIFDFPGQGYSEGFHPIHAIYLPKLNLFLRFGSFHESGIHYQNGDCVQATKDAITYLTTQSPIADNVNQSSIGLIGHSLGGLVVTETAAQDPRVRAAVTLSHATPDCIQNITIPIQFIGGDLDLTPASDSIPILRHSYRDAHAPKELIFIAGGTHLGFTSALGPLCPCPSWQKTCCLHYAIGWFDWFLRGQPQAYDNITSGDKRLSLFLQSQYDFGNGNHILPRSN